VDALRKAKGKGKGEGKGKRKAKRKAKAKNRARFVDLTILGMLLLAAYFAIFGGEYTVFELRKLEALEVRASAELANVEAEIDSLAALALELRDDPEAIERVARERYGMIREGEILYRFQETPEPPDEIDEDKERK
jgi:cell division protein FtsB